MAERVLPSRDEVVGELDGDTEAGEAIIEAYASRRLKTEAEWREAIDYEATLPHLMDLRADAQDPDREDIGYYHDGELLNVGKAIVDAALGEPKAAVKEIIDEDQDLLDRLAET